jgi:hypothetical protein
MTDRFCQKQMESKETESVCLLEVELKNTPRPKGEGFVSITNIVLQTL